MDSDRTVAEMKQMADRIRSPFSAFKMLSGGFRTKLTEAFGAAAVLHAQRVATEADRDAIQEELRQYRTTLAKAASDMDRLGSSLTSTMQRAAATEAEVLDVQRRALSQEKKERELSDQDRRLLALSEDLGKRHHEIEKLSARLSDAESSNALLLSQTREIEDTIRAQLATIDGRGAKVASDEVAFADRRRTLVTGEGTLDAGRAALAAAEAACAKRRTELSERDTKLTELQSRLERDQAAANEMHAQLVALVATAHEHERVMDAHQKEWAKRLAEQNARTTELDARKLAYDRERVELDGKISNLQGLDERNEQLLRFKAYLDEDQKRLNAEMAGVRENQKRTVDTWEELKITLARIEELEKRVQDTNDSIERLRDETERRAQEATEAARRRSLLLDTREREILNWRMQSELRERKVQERYNELDTVEARKNAVRVEIAELEREHAARSAEWEREQHRARQLWTERRAEAEKARELYERNTTLVEKRLAEIASREQQHVARARELEQSAAELTERERRLRAAEERIRLLEEQRDSLNSVISSLTTQVGRDWPSPESRLESTMSPPTLEAPLDMPAITPPPGRRPESSGSAKPAGRNGGGAQA